MSQRCWRTFPARADELRPLDDRFHPKRSIPELNPNRKHLMQNLSPRHVKKEEALRLGVGSGWYSTKVSGTFVSGPHDTETDCLLKIPEMDPDTPRNHPSQHRHSWLSRSCRWRQNDAADLCMFGLGGGSSRLSGPILSQRG